MTRLHNITRLQRITPETKAKLDTALVSLRAVEQKIEFYQTLEASLLEAHVDPDQAFNALEMLLSAMSELRDTVREVRDKDLRLCLRL